MDRKRWTGILFFCFLMFITFSPRLHAEVCNRVVAIVNEDVITLYELNHKIKQLTGMEPEELRSQDEAAFLDARRKILDFLIDDKIAQKKIDELGIKVSPSDIDAAIEKMKRDNNLTQEDLLARIEQQGISYETLRDNIRDEIERMQLINFEVKSKIIVREEAMEAYYDKHREQFVTHETLHLAAIILPMTNTSDRQEKQRLQSQITDIHRRLSAGEDFGELAGRFSQGPGAREGGDLGLFKTSQLNKGLLEAVERLQPGQISTPIETPSGFQILKLIDRQPGDTKTYEDAKDAIYSELYREEINKRYMEWLEQLRDQAYTKIIF